MMAKSQKTKGARTKVCEACKRTLRINATNFHLAAAGRPRYAVCRPCRIEVRRARRAAMKKKA